MKAAEREREAQLASGNPPETPGGIETRTPPDCPRGSGKANRPCSAYDPRLSFFVKFALYLVLELKRRTSIKIQTAVLIRTNQSQLIALVSGY